MFNHSVIDGLGFFIFFICYIGNAVKNDKTRFFFVLYSDKAWVFYQLECVQGSLNIISGTKGDVKVFQFNFERFLSASDLIKDSLCNVYHGLDWAG